MRCHKQTLPLALHSQWAQHRFGGARGAEGSGRAGRAIPNSAPAQPAAEGSCRAGELRAPPAACRRKRAQNHPRSQCSFKHKRHEGIFVANNC